MGVPWTLGVRGLSGAWPSLSAPASQAEDMSMGDSQPHWGHVAWVVGGFLFDPSCPTPDTQQFDETKAKK